MDNQNVNLPKDDFPKVAVATYVVAGAVPLFDGLGTKFIFDAVKSVVTINQMDIGYIIVICTVDKILGHLLLRKYIKIGCTYVNIAKTWFGHRWILELSPASRRR